jgi:hypothetical protein
MHSAAHTVNSAAGGSSSSAHLVLCVVVVWYAVHEGLGGHGLVEGRVKHTNL